MRPIDADALKAEIQRRRKRYKTLTGVDMAMLIDDAPTVGGRISAQDRLPEIETAHPAVRCAECTFFEVRDWWTTPDENGISLLAASDWPTCTRWGTGDSATSPDGWCFLGKQRPGRPGGDDRKVEND
jgi:hypothetical protein